MDIDYDAIIDCAAIKMPDGRVWTGKRHHHCIATIVQATGQNVRNEVQGFVTMEGRFVDRQEAMLIAQKAGQLDDLPRHKTDLFSEDLY